MKDNMRKKIMMILRDINRYEAINDETDLINSSILDSVAIMVLVNEIEAEFEIELDIEDLVVDSFRNINAIECLIYKYLKKR